jgi:hypothetical protein
MESNTIYVRKEIYDPSTGKYTRELIASSPVQKANTATGAGADLDVLTYSVPTGRKLYIYKIGLSGGDSKTFKISYGTTVIDYITIEANKQYSDKSDTKTPLYVIPGGQTLKITCISATASVVYNASFAGIER